MAAFAKSWRLE